MALALAALAMRNLVQYGTVVAVPPIPDQEWSLDPGRILWALRNLAWSFWLAAGRTYQIHLPPFLYLAAVGPMIGLSLLGWRRRAVEARSLSALWVVVLAAVLASLAFTLSYPPGAQTSWGKNLFPVLPVIATLLAGGWRGLGSGVRRVTAIGSVLFLLAGDFWLLAQLAR